jgi:hypothetical protein
LARRSIPQKRPTGLIEEDPNVFGYVQGDI